MKLENAVRVYAGGPGSGRKPGFGTGTRDAVESYLASRGYKKHQMGPDDDTHPHFWAKNVDPDPQTEADDTEHHTVMVNPDGSWEHFSETHHMGKTFSGLPRVAAMARPCASGSGIRALKDYLASVKG